MRAFIFIPTFAFVFASCAPISSSQTQSPLPQLSAAQKNAVGKQIWKNESGGKIEGLTAWNVGEEFPSLGIGHFIWYPANYQGPFQESWPAFIAFARAQGINPPAIAQRKDAPWSNRTMFQKHFHHAEMRALRQWLASTISLQTDFIIQRSRAALPKILAAAPPGQRERIAQNYRKVATTPQGTYALIDYVNFKGDGTKASERYKGQGWGLLQVLANMRKVPTGSTAASEFSNSAKRMLDRRIQNSPPQRGETRWRAGWFNRCDTYARKL